MTESKKEAPRVYKWAIITQHPWLPSRTDQVARARAWGIEKEMLGKMDISAIIEDDVRSVKRTTNWMGKLVQRVEFLTRLRAYLGQGDPVEVEIFFADPLCVGFSANVAKDTIDLVWAAGADVYVHAVKGNGAAIYRKGDDLTEFLEGVELAANAAHQRSYRMKQSRKAK